MTSTGHPKLPTNREIGQFDLTTYDNVSGSPSKLKYSFGKQNRFQIYTNRRITHQQVGYTLPTTKNSRAAGFGIGERFGNSNKKERGPPILSPPPNAYNIPTVFSPNNTTTTFAVHCKGPKTFAFGTGRDSYRKTVVNRENLQTDPLNPGPGQYVPLKPLGKDALAFKLKGKLDYFDAGKQAIRRGIPGAGTYEDVFQLDKEGKYNCSQYNNSKSARWSKDCRMRLPKYTHYMSPAPGTYKAIGNVAQGIQTLSNFHTVQTRRFGTESQRSEWSSRFKTPGPGTYQPPSDFGYVTLSPRQNKDTVSGSGVSTPRVESYGRQNLMQQNKHTSVKDISARSHRINATFRSTYPSLNNKNKGPISDPVSPSFGTSPKSRNSKRKVANTNFEVRESPELQELHGLWKTANKFTGGPKSNDKMHQHLDQLSERAFQKNQKQSQQTVGDFQKKSLMDTNITLENLTTSGITPDKSMTKNSQRLFDIGIMDGHS